MRTAHRLIGVPGSVRREPGGRVRRSVPFRLSPAPRDPSPPDLLEPEGHAPRGMTIRHGAVPANPTKSRNPQSMSSSLRARATSTPPMRRCGRSRGPHVYASVVPILSSRMLTSFSQSLAGMGCSIRPDAGEDHHRFQNIKSFEIQEAATTTSESSRPIYGGIKKYCRTAPHRIGQ